MSVGRTGYHAKRRTSNRKAVHTDRGCSQLRRASRVVEVDIDEDEPYCEHDDEDSDWHICGFCSGEYEPGTSGNGLRNMLANPEFGPENLGLSPMGERADE